MKSPKEIATINIQGPGLPLWAVAAIIVTLIIGALWWRASIRSERDAWWRTEIAKKSQAVEKIVTAGNREAEITDEEVLNAVGDQDDALSKAERDLAEARNRKPTVVTKTEFVREPEPDCPRVPARCLAQ